MLRDNLETIVGHFRYFVGINAVYELLMQAMEEREQEKDGEEKEEKENGGWVERYGIKSGLLLVVNVSLEKDSVVGLLSLDKLPCFLVKLLELDQSKDILSTIERYIGLLATCHDHSDLSCALMTATSISIIADQLFIFVQYNLNTLLQQSPKGHQEDEEEHQEEEGDEPQSSPSTPLATWMTGILSHLLQLSQNFQQNFPLRLQLKQITKSPKSHLPSLLKSSLLLSSSLLALHSQTEELTSQGLCLLLREVEAVLHRQA